MYNWILSFRQLHLCTPSENNAVTNNKSIKNTLENGNKNKSTYTYIKHMEILLRQKLLYRIFRLIHVARFYTSNMVCLKYVLLDNLIIIYYVRSLKRQSSKRAPSYYLYLQINNGTTCMVRG